jgi:hypothetical protein
MSLLSAGFGVRRAPSGLSRRRLRTALGGVPYYLSSTCGV